MADLTPGNPPFMGSRRSQFSSSLKKSASTGQLGRTSIPGYTGHVLGRNAENVSGTTHAESARLAETAVAKRMVPRSGADSERTRQWRGFDVLSQTIDMGSMNAGIGTSNLDGLTQSSNEHGPPCKTASMFYNPHGHTKFRSGASVPGYCGHIPGKYAGNVFATTYAQSNLAASGVRRRKGADGADGGTNWILACEFDKAAKNHGAAADLRKTIRSIGFHEGQRSCETNQSVLSATHRSSFDSTVSKPSLQMRMPKTLRHQEQLDSRTWRTYEPTQTHHKLHCYGH